MIPDMKNSAPETGTPPAAFRRPLPACRRTRALAALALTAATVVIPSAWAQQSNIAATRHNLSASNTAVQNRASSETEICVFCHTPHGSVTAAPAPLWNRSFDSGQTYTPYTSTSLDAEYIGGVLGQPGASSKLCLSCHDGTLAIGQVSNAPGSGLGSGIAMTGGAGSPIGAGADATTGYTRRLGTDLRNDHPISFTYDAALATRDGELRSPPYTSGTTLIVDNNTPSTKRPKLPLYSANQVQCSTCHEPHYSEPKFLRGKRLQRIPAAGGDYRDGDDQICLACHSKLGPSWANSAHAKGGAGGLDQFPGNVVYVTDTATTGATVREFPAGTMVWQAGCLNCHDTHTVQGAKRLLREGTDSTATPKAGGNPAQEQVCYQCHTTAANSAVTVGTLTATTGVPNIQSEFALAVRMPIATAEQAATFEVHEIGFNASETYKTATVNCLNGATPCGADFMETRARLGATDATGGTHTNRHVECTDCHNPHRVIKNALFNGLGSNTRRTHVPGGAGGNIASGALRGTWGVEPGYTAVTATEWPVVPSSYAIKRGDPPTAASTARSSTWLTREYQLCFKCHSDYGAGPNMPQFDNHTTGRTPLASNGFAATTRWTNVAAEFGGVNATEPPSAGTDQGEHGACSAGCVANYTNIDPTGSVPADAIGTQMTDIAGVQNHRSWHPVMFPTGRSHAERRISNTAGANFRAPFNGTTSPDGLGLQTMTCSDCHGAGATSWEQGIGPNLAAVQGPHGSPNPFLLRGTWSTATTIGSAGFCGNCHNPTAGTSGTGDSAGTGRTSGFNNAGTNSGGGHGAAHNGRPCMRCHVAVPHGWRNKALLVNLNCRGPEGGAATCDPTSGFGNLPDKTGSYNNAPYYVDAFLRVRTWVPSGNWAEGSCGRSGLTGKDWMTSDNRCN
jgi:hypothetical protein